MNDMNRMRKGRKARISNVVFHSQIWVFSVITSISSTPTLFDLTVSSIAEENTFQGYICLETERKDAGSAYLLPCCSQYVHDDCQRQWRDDFGHNNCGLCRLRLTGTKGRADPQTDDDEVFFDGKKLNIKPYKKDFQILWKLVQSVQGKISCHRNLPGEWWKGFVRIHSNDSLGDVFLCVWVCVCGVWW